MTTTLSPTSAAALEALARSPIAAQATALHESERTTQRSAILAKLAADESASRKKIDAAAIETRLERNNVERLQAELLRAVETLRRVTLDELNATTAAESARNRARDALSELGGDAVDRALSVVRFAQRQSELSVQWKPIRDYYGSELLPRINDPAHTTRATHFKKVADRLEALRLDPRATPVEIDLKCAEAIAEAERTAPQAEAAGARRWVRH